MDRVMSLMCLYRQTKQLVLTRSSLYGVWDQPKMPDSFSHIKIEAIVGGWVRDMERALDRIYTCIDWLEINLIAGINIFGKEQQARNIIRGPAEGVGEGAQQRNGTMNLHAMCT